MDIDDRISCLKKNIEKILDLFDPFHGTSVNNQDEATTVLQNSNGGNRAMDQREGNGDIIDKRDKREGNRDNKDKMEWKRTNKKCDVM